MSDYPMIWQRDERDLSKSKHLETVEAGVLIPLQQAGITGLFVGLICLVSTVYFAVDDWPIISLLSWLVSTFLVWLILQKRWLSLTAVEKWTGQDLNHDGVIGDPEQTESPRHTVTVELVTAQPNGCNTKTLARLPVSEYDLSLVAGGLLAGRPFSERQWTGQGKPLSVNQFRDLRDEMSKRGIVEQANPKDPRQGYKLTKAGQAVMRHFSPTLPDGLLPIPDR